MPAEALASGAQPLSWTAFGSATGNPPHINTSTKIKVYNAFNYPGTRRAVPPGALRRQVGAFGAFDDALAHPPRRMRDPAGCGALRTLAA
ncbi:hypothetical protein GCM10010286_31640 [Streptomyces toxytricini]|nr:hypothetical protein GCM10010286_31640 [Streptomyces toxytricini]